MPIPNINTLRNAKEGDTFTVHVDLTTGEESRIRMSTVPRRNQDAVYEKDGKKYLNIRDARGRYGGIELDGSEAHLMLTHAIGVSGSVYNAPIKYVKPY